MRDRRLSFRLLADDPSTGSTTLERLNFAEAYGSTRQSWSSVDVAFLTTPAFARPSKAELATWTVTTRSQRQRDGPIEELVEIFRDKGL